MPANFGAWTPPEGQRAVAVLADLGVTCPRIDVAALAVSAALPLGSRP